MPELPSSVAEVHSHMAYRAQSLIFLRFQFGIKQPRLIGRGGAQYKFTDVLGAGQIMLLAKLLQRQFLSQQIKPLTRRDVTPSRLKGVGESTVPA